MEALAPMHFLSVRSYPSVSDMFRTKSTQRIRPRVTPLRYPCQNTMSSSITGTNCKASRYRVSNIHCTPCHSKTRRHILDPSNHNVLVCNTIPSKSKVYWTAGMSRHKALERCTTIQAFLSLTGSAMGFHTCTHG